MENEVSVLTRHSEHGTHTVAYTSSHTHGTSAAKPSTHTSARTDHTYDTHGAPRSKDNPLACIVSDDTPTKHPVITKETPVPPQSDLTDQGKTARCSRAYGGEGR